MQSHQVLYTVDSAYKQYGVYSKEKTCLNELQFRDE